MYHLCTYIQGLGTFYLVVKLHQNTNTFTCLKWIAITLSCIELQCISETYAFILAVFKRHLNYQFKRELFFFAYHFMTLTKKYSNDAQVR